MSFYRACQRMRERIANDLFLHDDLRAHRRGWTVEAIHGGTGRRYHDPRWDRLSECGRCRGAGTVRAVTCEACGGRGVIDSAATTTVDPPAEEPDDRPRTIRVSAQRMDLPEGGGS